VYIKRIWALVIAGLFLVTLILPQVALADGPEISDVDVEEVSFTTATINWTTNTSSNCTVYYGTTKPPSSHEPGDSADGKEHSVTLEGLDSDEKYYFAIECIDASGNSTDDNSGLYYSFTTLPLIEYTISLSAYSGYCGDEIEVTAFVEEPGNYRICWAPETTETLTSTHSKKTFTASSAESYTVAFLVPDTEKGIYTVHLTREDYTKLAEADFEVMLFVKVDPDEGPVGTEVTISGSGFAASQNIRVNFFQGEVKKGTEKTDTSDTNGRWDLSYTIPEVPSDDAGDPDDDCAFIVEFQEDGVWYDLVGRSFEVTPKITVSSSSGIVGHTIEVKGTGFKGNEKDIEITFDGEVTKTNTPIVANPNGSWDATVVIPPISRGTHTIDASGESTVAGDVPGVEFTVGAGISIDPISARVGHTVTVEGGGFAVRETGVQVHFDGVVVTTSNIPVNSDGYWKSSFTVPASAYGSHTVSASGDITTSAATATFSTQARIMEVSPSSGAPGDLVSLTGDGFGSGEQLTVNIGGVAASGNTGTQSNGNVVISFRVPKDVVAGTQTLVVTGGSGASASTDFTVTTKTLSTTPLPISPKGSTLRSGEVTFNWQGVGGDTGYTYTLEIGENDNSGTIWSKAGIEETIYTLTDTETVTETLPKGNYDWRVKLVDDYGNESPWSERIEFRVSPIPIWVWVIVGVVVLIVLMYVAYRETKFKVTEWRQ
jgi:hypothetical protein